jgi:hypothetical protein
MPSRNPYTGCRPGYKACWSKNMTSSNPISIDEKLRTATRMPQPRPEFLASLRTRLAEEPPRPISLGQRLWIMFRRPAWAASMIALLLVAGFFIAGPQRVYAAVRQLFGLNDPGLQSVHEAGLVTDLNVTAMPTVITTITPAGTPQPASTLALSQTLEGVTLTLDWIYLDEGRLALGMKFTDLPSESILNAPQVTFVNVSPVQSQGYIQSLRSDENQAVYVSYQVIHADSIGGKASFGVDVPLVRQNGDTQTTVANFHFNVKDIPVYAGQTLPIQQTYAVQRNGVEVRLKSVRIMPSTTEVVACYDFPTQDAPFWYMQYATVQIGSGPEESYRPYQYLSEIKDDHCVKLGFATGSAGSSSSLVFRVRQLVVPLTMQDVLPAERIEAANQELAQYGIEIKPASADQTEGPGGWQFVRKPDQGTDPTKDPSLLVLQTLEEKVEGPWEFYVEIPSENIIPGQAAPTPTATPSALGEHTIGGVTMTLDWLFADAKRVAFGYTIAGLPNIPDAMILSGNIVVKDQQGNPIGGGGGHTSVQWVEGQPGTVTGSWSSVMPDPLNQTETTFSIDVTLDGSNGYDWNNTIAVFEQSPGATALPPGILPPSLPDRLVGTFHFDIHTKVYPMKVIEPKQSVTANGINVRLEQAEITPSYARFTLCYPKPSSKDWMVGGTPTLKAGTYEAQISGYSLLIDSDYGGYIGKSPKPTDIPDITAGERCVQIDFLLGHSSSAQTMTLTIPALEQSIPEVIPDAEVKAAQEKLKAQGIEMDYTTSRGAGGGGGGPIFTKKPEGMTDLAAYQEFMAALGYSYPGPWVFTIEIP